MSKIIRTLVKTDPFRDDISQQQSCLLKNFCDIKYSFERALHYCSQLLVDQSDFCEVMIKCTSGRADSVRVILLAARADDALFISQSSRCSCHKASFCVM